MTRPAYPLVLFLFLAASLTFAVACGDGEDEREEGLPLFALDPDGIVYYSNETEIRRLVSTE